MSTKEYLEKNVYEATVERLEKILKEFPRVYLSFSGGKDSSVLLQMTLEIAERLDALPIGVLYVDFEAQYQSTIKHIKEMLINNPKVEPYWVCLPFNLKNAVSVFQSHWQCWHPEKKEKWVRALPEYDCVISDQDYFPFFRFGMEFEDFVVEFAKWYAKGEKTAGLIAIRTDESYNRFRTIKSEKKERYKKRGYSTKVEKEVYYFYPIYDWKTEDIWTAVGKYGYKYNKIYDLMYQQGRSIHECRICQPYGYDQRRGLDLIRVTEPETWSKIVDRVAGVNFGAMYANSYLLGHRSFHLPEGHSWKSYTIFLLNTLPRFEAEWYKIKFQTFLDWWGENGYPIDKKWQPEDEELPPVKYSSKMPDKAERRRETRRKVPSWRRLAEVLIKNDKLCKRLTFSGTKYQYDKYQELRERYGV
jgi:predicted phosphoadenosine phosphosulfate sulfurtransferase